jgi:RNA-directed DNA polymerase
VQLPRPTHLVILCRTERAAREALRRVGEVLTGLGLALHPDKTRVVFVGDGEQGFDFLGFHCRKVGSWRVRGRRYLHRWPSRRAMQRVRDRIKAITAPRYRLREPVQTLVDELNRLLRGWGAYFRVGTASGQFRQVDDYVRERLALFLSKKTGRRGRQWGRHSVTLFRALGVYQLSGTVKWYSATPRAAR